MSNETTKQGPAHLEYSEAVAKDGAAFYGRTAPKPKTEMTELDKAKHQAFLTHPLAGG